MPRKSSKKQASVLLYPKIASRIRVLIYNGDADMCVPYNGNEEWLAQLEADVTREAIAIEAITIRAITIRAVAM